MTRSFSELIKGPIEQEKRLGYTDKAVVGGFGLFVERQLAGKDDDLAARFKGYSSLSVEERQALVGKLETAHLAGHVSRATGHGSKKRGHATRDKSPRSGINDTATTLQLDTPIKELPDLTRGQQMAFNKLGLKTVQDLLGYYPRWPLHRDLLTPIGKAKGEELFLGRINGWEAKRKGKLLIIRANIEDGSGFFSWVWFNQPYIKDELENGRWLVVRGRIEKSSFGRQLGGKSGSYAFLTDDEVKRLKDGALVLRYHTTRTLGQALLSRLIGEALKACASQLEENFLPSLIAFL